MRESALIKNMMATVEKYHMLEKGDGVVVGLSGGADSAALFHALLCLRPVFGVTVSAAHVNHGLRGAEAARDEAFARELCAARGVLLSVFHFDIAACAKEKGLTLEEAGRLKRYEAFEAARAKHGAQKIAVAHNLNDQAETVLMRVIRGTGVHGLAGIPAVRGAVIRPLIAASRVEIEGFMAENGLAFISDSSNDSEDYTRNKLRLRLLPYIKAELNPNIINTLARTARLAAEENDYLEEQAAAVYQNCLVPGGVAAAVLKKVPVVLQKRVIRKACLAAGGIKDISFDHINDILKLADNQSGRRLTLPNGLTVLNSFGTLVFSNAQTAAPEGFSYPLPIGPRGVYIKETGFYVTASPEEIKCFGNLNNICTKRFDCDRIVGTLSLRSPRPGDRIAIRGGSKKISRWFAEEKFPLADRARVPLVADAAAVLWIIGGRVSADHPAKGGARATVTIQLWEERQ
jgi:tRNA(Ile)-lysidine synthase